MQYIKLYFQYLNIDLDYQFQNHRIQSVLLPLIQKKNSETKYREKTYVWDPS